MSVLDDSQAGRKASVDRELYQRQPDRDAVVTSPHSVLRQAERYERLIFIMNLHFIEYIYLLLMLRACAYFKLVLHS